MHSYAPPPNTPCLQKDAFDLGVLLACGGDVHATSLWRQAEELGILLPDMQGAPLAR